MKMAYLKIFVYVCFISYSNTAGASEITCTVPNGVLHDACVTHLSVTLRNLHCFITFVPTCYSIHVVPNIASKPIRSGVTPHPNPPTSSCFVFNGERYCE